MSDFSWDERMHKYDVSIVTEWENVLLAEEERCVRMLRQLRLQVLASSRSIEVLVVFNPRQVAGTVVDEAVRRYLLPPGDTGRVIPCRIEPAPNLHYYQLKNFGAQLALGNIIVFLDSDVIPEEGWLQAITQPFFDHPEISVLAGHTYLDPNGLLGRAFALGWYFPLRSHSLKLASDTKYFFANNVAFRRHLLEKYPFPEMPEGKTRGACSRLAQILIGEGTVIWSNAAAQTSHPPPNGFSHFLIRGFAQGRDWAITKHEQGTGRLVCSFIALRNVFSDSFNMSIRTIRNGHTIALPFWQAPIAVGIMSIYYIEICLGAWMYLIAPGPSSRMWRV